jgi:NAD-dependent deacetylase
MKKLIVLSGAGISAESGISTFRDSNGLWENHDIMDVASPIGWRKDAELVINFYNARRRQLKEVKPNAAHLFFATLESQYQVTVITQNVDNLHERGGSSDVMHLHGELTKVRSTVDESLIFDWTEDLNIGDRCPKGSQLRPHIVWFGEAVPKLEVAAHVISQCDIVVIVGTSMQVYPAAGLVDFAPDHASVYYIDPRPQPNYEISKRGNLIVIPEKATLGVTILDKYLSQT